MDPSRFSHENPHVPGAAPSSRFQTPGGPAEPLNGPMSRRNTFAASQKIPAEESGRRRSRHRYACGRSMPTSPPFRRPTKRTPRSARSKNPLNRARSLPFRTFEDEPISQQPPLRGLPGFLGSASAPASSLELDPDTGEPLDPMEESKCGRLRKSPSLDIEVDPTYWVFDSQLNRYVLKSLSNRDLASDVDPFEIIGGSRRERELQRRELSDYDRIEPMPLEAYSGSGFRGFDWDSVDVDRDFYNV